MILVLEIIVFLVVIEVLVGIWKSDCRAEVGVSIFFVIVTFWFIVILGMVRVGCIVGLGVRKFFRFLIII